MNAPTTLENKTQPATQRWQTGLKGFAGFWRPILLSVSLACFFHAGADAFGNVLLRVSPTNQVALQMDAVDAVYDPANELFYIAFTAYDGNDSSHSLWMATATTNALMNCEKIGLAQTDRQISVALTVDGRPAVAWYSPGGPLMYAEKRTDTTWSNEVVTTWYRNSCSLALDPSTGLPLIACNSTGDWNLDVIGKSSGGVWSTAFSSWNDACFESLVFHPVAHKPTASIQTLGWTGNPARLYYWNNGTWVHVDGDTDFVGYGNDLVYDSTATPHIVYFNLTKGQLRHAWETEGGAWTNEVAATGVFGGAISLAISKSNQYHGSFVTWPYSPPYNLWYVNGANGSWISTNLCSASDLSPWSSTVLGPAERPFIVFAAREGVWLAEPQSLSLPPPSERKAIFTSQPSGGIWQAGATAYLSAGVSGSGLSYRWWKDGVCLTNNGQVSGATTTYLSLYNLRGGNAGNYSLIVSNASGALTSAVAVVSVIEPTISVQPVTQPVAWGQGATLSVTAVGTEPLFYQWYHEGSALAGEDAGTLPVADVQSEDLGAYYVVVSNQYGVVTSTVANLLLNLAVPDTFNPGANSYVYSLAVQGDGKILVGGGFTALGGLTRSRIGRLNGDGTVDTNFNPGANSYVYSLAVQGDGKILVGGDFTILGGQPRNRIGRLNSDGTVDVGFNPGANSTVYPLAVQPDGKILVGGNFTMLGGQTRNYIGRLNADGTVDSSFNPGANSSVYSLSLQADGKILLGGWFTTLGGQTRNFIGRLNADGTVDSSFNPGANSSVYSLSLQADGKILAGGYFSSLGGQPRDHIGRLNSDGTVDTSFNPGANDRVTSFAVQADGKILVSGDGITTLGGQTRNYIGRLNADGTLDASFNPWANDAILALALQTDGKILVGGSFSYLGGQTRNGIGRLNPTEPATQSLSFDGSAITWLQNGSSPAFCWTTFDVATAGTGWSRLGLGTNVAGVWQMTGLSLPTNASILARGYVSGGFFNGSGWFVEKVIGRPVISDLEIQSNRFGFNVRGETGETVVVEGSTRLSNPSWLPLCTNLLSSGPIYFNDPAWTNYSQRFYRLSVTP